MLKIPTANLSPSSKVSFSLVDQFLVLVFWGWFTSISSRVL